MLPASSLSCQAPAPVQAVLDPVSPLSLVSGQPSPAAAPTFLVCTPRPATGSVPALAAPSLSVSCAGSLRPGPAYCTGPLIWCFEASLASASSPLHSSIGLQALRATNLLRWKAARKCQSLWLAGSVGALQTTNRQSRHPTVLRAGSRAVTSAVRQDLALVHGP